MEQRHREFSCQMLQKMMTHDTSRPSPLFISFIIHFSPFSPFKKSSKRFTKMDFRDGPGDFVGKVEDVLAKDVEVKGSNLEDFIKFTDAWIYVFGCPGQEVDGSMVSKGKYFSSNNGSQLWVGEFISRWWQLKCFLFLSLLGEIIQFD